jgi:EAL domain-containing protein (putative c-di-GMP-specific phosphodiesterase class I)
MDALTRLVLNTALRHAATFDQQGAQLDLAVNLSPSMMADGALPDRVAQVLATWRLPPGRLVFEVTEDSIVRDGEATLGVMRRLHALGTRLSIDDFGTGHSSFARMRDMPLAELKIDRLFIAGMTARRDDMQLVRSVIDLAHNFDLRVVAEGVEDAVTFAMLRGMGCDAVQGYYCARPMAAEELLRWWPARPRNGVEVVTQEKR